MSNLLSLKSEILYFFDVLSYFERRVLKDFYTSQIIKEYEEYKEDKK